MESQITYALEKRLRFYLASQTLFIGRERAANAIKDWLEEMPTVGNFAEGKDARLQPFNSDLQQLTWRASGETVGVFRKCRSS
jgi:hypothetical protein